MEEVRVIVATELSRSGAAIARHGALLARAEGASLHLVHYESPAFAAPFEHGSLLPFFQSVPQSTASAHARLGLIANSVERYGLPIHAAVMAAPLRGLSEQVNDDDIVVVGTRPRGWLSIGLRRSFLSQCLSTIPGGLLVVPESATTRPVATVLCALGSLTPSGPLSHYAAFLSERFGATVRVLLQSDGGSAPPAGTAYARAEWLLRAAVSASSNEDRMWVVTSAPKADTFTRGERVAYERLLRSSRSPVLFMGERRRALAWSSTRTRCSS